MVFFFFSYLGGVEFVFIRWDFQLYIGRFEAFLDYRQNFPLQFEGFGVGLGMWESEYVKRGEIGFIKVHSFEIDFKRSYLATVSEIRNV